MYLLLLKLLKNVGTKEPLNVVKLAKLLIYNSLM